MTARHVNAKPPTAAKPRAKKWRWPAAIAATILGTFAIAAWMIWPRAIDFYTDSATIRVHFDETTPRDILWQPPIPLSEHLNTTDEDYEPRLSWDGMTLYFVRGKTGGNADIYFSTRLPRGWTDPQPLEAINSSYDDLGPEPTSDGTAIYFYSDRPGGSGGYDIWVAERTNNGGWRTPRNLGPNVNSEYNDYGPACTPDRETLYFASNRPLPDDEISLDPHAWQATAREARYARTYDLYRSALTDAGPTASSPIAKLNTREHEAAPCVSPSGDFLYFCSNRPGGVGGFDLYRVRLFPDRYGDIEPLENGINTGANELDPALTYLGFGLFFSSDRLTGDEPPPTTDAAAPPPNYNLYFSHSREVFAARERESINWGDIAAAILANLWWLLLALLALLLLLLGGKALRSKRLSLLARCILASALLHLLLMLILSLWHVSHGIMAAIDRDGGMQITVSREALADNIATQIRGNLTAVELPSVQTVAQTMDVQTPEFTPPQPSALVEIQQSRTPPQQIHIESAAPELTARTPPAIPISREARQTPLETPATSAATPIAMPLPEALPQLAQEPARAPRTFSDAFAAIEHSPPTVAELPTPDFTSAAAPQMVSNNRPQKVTAILEFVPDFNNEPPTPHQVRVNVDRAQRQESIARSHDESTIEVALSLPEELPQEATELPVAENDSREWTADAGLPPTSLAELPVPEITDATAPQLVARDAPRPRSEMAEFAAKFDNPATSVRPIEVSTEATKPRATDRLPAESDFELATSLDLPPLEESTAVARQSDLANDFDVPALQVAANSMPHIPNVPADQLPLEITEPTSVPSREAARTASLKNVEIGVAAAAPPTEIAALSPRHSTPALNDFELELGLPEPIKQPDTPPLAQRAPEERHNALKQHGGNEETEAAVRRALQWLANHQSENGSWRGDHFPSGCDCDGTSEHRWNASLTGLSLLCFLGAGHTHLEDGPYRETVAKALNWLTESQLRNGDLRGKETMYSHGIATIALCEAFAMTKDESLRDAASRAAEFIVRGRNRRVGGWRYEPGQDGDTSVLGWQVMALHSARNAGLEVAEVAFINAGQFLDNVESRRRPGLYAYRPRQSPTRAMTAEGIFVRQLLGMDAGDERMERAVAVIRSEEPEWGDDANTYYWYYATLALYNVQGPEWRDWNDHLSKLLVNAQQRDGHEEGSWATDGEWANIGSRVYQTALCTLMLEIYYRYLPMYSTESSRTPTREAVPTETTLGS